jgi:hypothetical protein
MVRSVGKSVRVGVENRLRRRVVACRVMGGISCVVVVLAGCSGSSRSAAPKSTTTATTAAAVTTTPTTPAVARPGGTTLSRSTASSPPTSAPDSCDPSVLAVSLIAEQGAGGSGYYYFRAVNHGTLACEAGGYFGASIYDQAGRLLSDTPGRMTTTLAGVAVHPVRMDPGGSASFMLQVVENPQNGPTRCPLIASFRFIPPNGTAAVDVPVPPSTSSWFCGAFNISPTTAAPQNQTLAPIDNAVKVYGNCQTPSLEPTEIVLTCADYGSIMTDLQWTTWTASEATAVGTLVYNDCTPNCAEGQHHEVPGTQVTLTIPVVGAGGQLVWSELQQNPLRPGYATGPLHGGPMPLPTRPD